MVDAEFVGEAYGWSRVASALGEQQLLDQRSIETLVWAETFGTWIGNTDMHLGNVSLQPTDEAFEAMPGLCPVKWCTKTIVTVVVNQQRLAA